MSPKKIIGVAVAGVGALDLLFGNTNQPLLPAFIANSLTQQYDLLLIAVGVFLIFF